MAIEYLKHIQAGGKIDLPSDEKKANRFRPEKLLENCHRLIKLKIKKYNEVLGSQCLDQNGAIEMINHPAYSPADTELVEAQKVGFASQFNQSVSEWEKRKELDPANLTELALTAMLQKILPERFLVVRSTAYDDYNNGIDKFIIDRETGNVVCGIDEVIARSYYSGPSKKEKKIKAKMAKGGFQAKYGLKFEQGALVLESLKNIPAFYLSLNREDLISLSQCLEAETISEVEKEIFNRLKESLLDQINSYEKQSLIKPLLENIKIFKVFLDSWN